jgi:uncharacterized protein YcnI
MSRSLRSLISSRQGTRVTALLIALLVFSSLAWARAVVFPKTSTTGAYERYSLRVVNERDVPIIRVEIRFPSGLRVISFGDVPDWKLQILTDSTQNITGGVWTGALPKARFVEFPFLAINPKDSTALNWPVYETYQGGERVEWTSPDTASKTPISSTLLSGGAPVPVRVSRTSLYISLIALLFALTALGVALRPKGVDVNP